MYRLHIERHNMKEYIVYFEWNDGQCDTIITKGADERRAVIMDMLKRGEFKHISYAYKYKSGEIGKRVILL